MKTMTPIIPSTNALGEAVATVLLAYRQPNVLQGRRLIAFNVKGDENYPDHIAIGIEVPDEDEEGGRIMLNRYVLILPTPPSDTEMLKHTVHFVNYGSSEEHYNYHLMDMRLVVVAAIEYLTVGEVLEGPEH